MDDTWASRDLPVLTAIVEYRDEHPRALWHTLREIAQATGLNVMDVLRAAEALDGDYITLKRERSKIDPSTWSVTAVTAKARQAVGQWPSGESLVEQLVAGLRAAELTESDPVQKGRLREAVDALGGIARDVVVQVATAVVSGSIPRI